MDPRKPKSSPDHNPTDQREKIRMINVAQEMVTLKDRVLELKFECERKEKLFEDLKEIMLENERLKELTTQRQQELVFLLMYEEELRELVLSDSMCVELEALLNEEEK